MTLPSGKITIPVISDIANKMIPNSYLILLIKLKQGKSITRLGNYKKDKDKHRLMKVQVANLSQKSKLLVNAKKLKQCSGNFQNIYLSPDLSYIERQANNCKLL